MSAKQREYTVENRDQISARQRRRYVDTAGAARRAAYKLYCEQHPREARDTHLRSLYNITLEQYEAMVESQDGKCAACDQVPSTTLHVDHDHSCCSGKKSCGVCVRGLLCRNCNAGAGILGDSPARLRGLADYLEHHADRA